MQRRARCVLTAAVAAVASSIWAGSGIPNVADVRVGPLLTTRWGQMSSTGYNNTGVPCFNYYTPNQFPCGCCATALAQVMRYWRHPASVSTASFPCTVNGAQQWLAITFGAYAWGDMPDDTATATEAQCQAIGKLTYDCAVAQRTMFYSSSSPANGSFAFLPLREVFGYANAIGYLKNGGMRSNEIRGTVLASLDAGSPVILSLLTAGNVGHEVVADGYGYEGGVEYVHLNFGYNNVRGDNAWYRLDDIEWEGTRYSVIDGIVYNVFPYDSGDVLSGRVIGRDGVPQVGVKVVARSGKSVVGEVETDSRGIYAFVLPGGKTYAVSAGGNSRSVTLVKSVCATASWSGLVPSYTDPGKLGNSWGNDLVYDTDTPAPGPDPADDLGSFNPGKAVNGVKPFCGVVCDAEGMVLGTISLKIGKPGKAKAGKQAVSKVSGTVTALNGKKYTFAAVSVPVNEMGSSGADSIVIKKFGTMNLRIGANGFSADIVRTDGVILSAETADLQAGLASGSHRFSIKGLPTEIDGRPVLALPNGERISPNGESVEVSAKGKWTLRKAAAIKYKKITVKDPETKKSTSHYELQGLDDPKKPNLSGLKLTYTSKTGMFKGSFNLYYNGGTGEKPKLKKASFTVTGIAIDGRGFGVATCKKPAVVLDVAVE